ncbi:DUF3027 domain-containing protein [Amnibacterium sp.]|uniref:DUF3027 domain-containing protein n=1 Tax=Amnibacterium sp. TaxID=1872496 RepID=UPI003F7B6BBC
MTVEERTALALAALAEVTDPADVGDLLDAEEVEPGVIDLRFACRLPAYADWHWTVSTSDLPDTRPTVLEVELLPGEGSLLAPPWVPWAERLADWRRQHPDEQHPGEAADEESEEDEGELDEGELDEDDLAVDDDLDELDDAELQGEGVDGADEPDAADDERAPRPAEEDRSL